MIAKGVVVDSVQQERIKTITGDITKITKGIICHQVNCMGKMGAGVALAIRKQWPIVYNEYIKTFQLNNLQLGRIFITTIMDQLFVVNLCGQYHYGRNQKQTNYDAVHTCLEKLNQEIIKHNMTLDVMFPYKMGCNLAGGNWNIMKTIISETITNNNILIIKQKGAK